VTAPSSTVASYDFGPAGRDRAGEASVESFSIGDYLATQRCLRGMTLEELADVTRIPRRSLERLEGGAFDRQQDAFVRGFVRTVSSAIGLDPQETLTHMRGRCAETREPRSVSGLQHFGSVAIGLALASLLLALSLSLAGRVEVSAVEGLFLRPAAPPVLQRDYVQELASRVRSASAVGSEESAALEAAAVQPPVADGSLGAH
jgi:cytoskeletal protein RodZ